MTRWLITGGHGMVGRDLEEALRSQAEEVVAVGRTELDVTDQKAVAALVREVRPAIIVNCAAWTKVDDAERHEDLATAVNGSAVEHLAHAADQHDALLVQISTDFVFDGSKRTPYEVNDVTGPISAYGRTKLVGEHEAAKAQKHLILRTAWLFGIHGPNFVEAIRNQLRKGNRALRVVDDQRGRPTYTPHLAHAVVRAARVALADESARGLMHYADESECTWFDLANAIIDGLRQQGALNEPVEVLPVTSDQFPRPAQRPAYSVLSTERYERVTGAACESWRDGLAEYLGLRAELERAS
jgi:dTDP-4-dehydrorhamnose reductase